ncbi:MAG: DUF3151 domain-containing protein [Chloroflexota bacterium]
MAQDRPNFVDLSTEMTPPTVLLPPEPAEALAALRAALQTGEDASPERYAALASVVRASPAFVGGWAHLAAAARALGRDIEAYAFGRTGYHRALDRLRGNGWRGMGLVLWSHEPNRSALLAFHELYLAARSIGETPEVDRLRKLLLDSDPSDPLGVGTSD